MNRTITGQILLILCCIVYLVWWYRGFRPGVSVNRVSGVTGVLLLVTAVLGLAGVAFSLMHDEAPSPWKISPVAIIIGGVIGYIVLLVVTRFIFHRVVTSELFLIIGWTMLETAVIDQLNAQGVLGDRGFAIMIAAAFIISMVLYVAYYKMEEMKAFYVAMVPLVTEGASMAVLVCIVAGKI